MAQLPGGCGLAAPRRRARFWAEQGCRGGGQTGGVQMGCRLQSELAITVVAQGVAGFADGSGMGCRSEGPRMWDRWLLESSGGGGEEVFRVQI